MRFETAVPLGRGATGEVVRAHDPRLGRDVALKLLRSDDPELVARMQREARLQARVDHPNVVRVHEVGDWEGRPYIAMDLVDGEPLDRAAEGLSRRQHLGLLATVARAVHAAHEEGLVHRDLKPGNILVETGDNGEPVPYVVDFGIAREAAVEGETVTGQMLGTPGYMSPEQARGETTLLDRRSDVFSLGAVLYEILTGAPPFAADSAVDSLVQVLSQDPVPPSRRAPGLSRDLETIVLTCLEKEPNHRYATAADLADDLERFLAGEAIRARAPSRATRLVRKARRHPVASGLGVAAIAGLLILGVLAAHSSWTARARAEAAQRFGAEAERMTSTMRQAHLAPLHDLSQEKGYVEARMERVRREMENLGPAARAAGHRALGEGYAALGQLPEARQHLEAAWQGGDESPDTAYALGRVLAQLYSSERERVRRSRDPEVRAERLAILDRDLKAPALDFLGRAESSPTVSPAYLRGLVAFVDGRWTDAAEAAAEARREAPLLWEAAVLEGRALYQPGIEALWSGDYDLVLEHYRRSRGSLEQAAAVGSSDPAVWERLCASSQILLEVHRSTGRDIVGPFEASLEECGNAITADPSLPGPWEKTARAWYRRSQDLIRRGEDPTKALERVVETARRSAELAPERAHLGRNLEALGWWMQADEERTKGRNPEPFLAHAATAARAAVEADPGYRHAHNSLGIVHHTTAAWLDDQGRDSRAAWRAAANAYRGALGVDPEFIYAWNNLGLVEVELAAGVERRGGDPRPGFAEAIAAYDAALQLNPSYANALSNRGDALLARAEYAWRQGAPWRMDLEAGLADQTRALEIQPENPTTLADVAQAHLLRARALDAEGRDPAGPLEQVRRAAGQALDLKADELEAMELLARAELLAARWAAHRGTDPAPALAAARAGFERVLALNPRVEAARQGLEECARLEAGKSDNRNSPAELKSAPAAGAVGAKR